MISVLMDALTGHSRSGDRVSNGSTLEKEFEDLFVKKVLVKVLFNDQLISSISNFTLVSMFFQSSSCNSEECAEDHESQGK